MLFSKLDLKRLIIPLVLEQFLAVAMGFVDTAMVSGVGPEAVSGVSLVDSINILLINVFAALATGGAVVTAQYLGRQELEKASLAAKQLLYTVLVVSIAISIFALVFRTALLELIFGNIDANIMENAKTYFLISAISYPFLAVYNGSAALMRTIGNSKVAMNTSIIMNIVNVIGNYLLIYVFSLGVMGAALSTLFCRMAGAVTMIFVLKMPHPMLHIKALFRPIFKKDMVLRILRIGVPNGLENSLFQLGKLIIQRLVATLGLAAITANAVSSTLASVMTIPGSAIGLALITVVGRCVGAKEFKQARYYVRSLMKLVYIVMTGFIILVLLLMPLILKYAFSLDSTTYDIAYELLLTYGIVAIICWSPSFVLPNALRAAGDAKFTMGVSIASMALCRVALSYIFVLVFNMNILGVWLAMMVDWVIRAIAFIVRFAKGKWETKAII